MKIYVIYFEPWNDETTIADNTVVVAEDLGKAKLYFRKYFDGRIVKVTQIKTVEPYRLTTR